MQNYMTARMFAREYGTLLGGAWTAMFAGAIMSVRSGNPLATLLMLLGAGTLPCDIGTSPSMKRAAFPTSMPSTSCLSCSSTPA